MPDGNFVVCRLAYRQVRREQSGIGWMTDYPYAEINLTTRFSELTKTRVSRDNDHTPNFYVVRPPTIRFQLPDARGLRRRDDRVPRRRGRSPAEYFLKGGFLWVDDFWGTPAWDHWASQIARVFPPAEYPIEDVQIGDPMLSMFEVKKIPQITNIQFWRRFGGTTTSERGEDSAVVHFRAIRDSHHRIMVLMTHNTDVADSWEREGEDPAFFYQFSPAGYALGIDVLLHAMTH